MLLWLGWLQTFEFYSPDMYYGTFVVCNVVIGIVVILVVTIKWGGSRIRNNVRFGLAVLWLFLATAGVQAISEWNSHALWWGSYDRITDYLIAFVAVNILCAIILIPRLINPDPLIRWGRKSIADEQNRREGIKFLSTALQQAPPFTIKVLSVSDKEISFRLKGAPLGEALFPILLFSFIIGGIAWDMIHWIVGMMVLLLGGYLFFRSIFRSKKISFEPDKIRIGKKDYDPSKVGAFRVGLTQGDRAFLSFGHEFKDEYIRLAIPEITATDVVIWLNSLSGFFYGSPEPDPSSAVHEKGYREQSY